MDRKLIKWLEEVAVEPQFKRFFGKVGSTPEIIKSLLREQTPNFPKEFKLPTRISKRALAILQSQDKEKWIRFVAIQEIRASNLKPNLKRTLIGKASKVRLELIPQLLTKVGFTYELTDLQNYYRDNYQVELDSQTAYYIKTIVSTKFKLNVGDTLTESQKRFEKEQVEKFK